MTLNEGQQDRMLLNEVQKIRMTSNGGQQDRMLSNKVQKIRMTSNEGEKDNRTECYRTKFKRLE